MKLNNLANMVKTEHAECLKAIRAVLAHARFAGEALIRAKAELEHGQYEPWVREVCGISPVTAWRYMQIAKNWANLSARKDIETLGINAALEVLTASASVSTGSGSSSWAVGGEWQDDLPLKTIHRDFRDFLREGSWRGYDDINRAGLLRELTKVEATIAKIKSELAGEEVVEKAA